MLLLDGVDEGGELKPRIESFITEFLVRQRISVVVTTRPEGYAKARYTDFQRMSLAPLDRKQQEQIIENRVGRLGLEALSSNLETMKDSEGQSICSNPLMLSMVISIFQSGGGRLPSSRYELYEKAIDTVLRRADVKQLGGNRAPGTCGADLSAVQRLLSLIAVRRHHEHDKDISVDDITIVVRDDETLDQAWQHIEAQLAMGRLPVLSCLDPRPQLKIRFAHLSFQEFLVAQEWVERHANFGVESNMHERIPSLATMLNDGWWHNTMRMACEQSEAVIHTIVGPHLSNSETVLDLSHTRLAGDNILDLILFILGCGLISPNLKELKLDANSIEGELL